MDRPTTVGELIAFLQRQPATRKVVLIDADTEWQMPLIVREPKEWEMDHDCGEQPLCFTCDYGDRP